MPLQILAWDGAFTADSTLDGTVTLSPAQGIVGDIKALTGKSALAASVTIASASGVPFDPRFLWLGFVGDVDGTHFSRPPNPGDSQAIIPLVPLFNQSPFGGYQSGYSNVITASLMLASALRVYVFYANYLLIPHEAFEYFNSLPTLTVKV